MFCFQCEQTAGGKGCMGKAGVCGKRAETADHQDGLVGALIALACSCTKVGIGWVGESAGLALLFCVLIVISAICAVFMERRNRKYARELGQIFGLRNFIEKAELPKLNLLVEEDPSYFYNILPYAYVMGLTEKWIKQFENIAVPPADWYDADDDL